MPTYEYKHAQTECQHEWEEVRSITAPDPTHCPQCGAEGNITHLISGGSGKGRVELYGNDLTDKIKADAKQLQRDAAGSEKIYANLLGEDKHQALQSRMDRQRRG